MRVAGYLELGLIAIFSLFSNAANAQDECSNYKVRNLATYNPSYIQICYVDGNVSILNKGNVESPENRADNQVQKNSNVHDVEPSLTKLVIDSESLQEAIEFFNSQKEPPPSNSPSEYELTKRDVEWNQFLMMLAAWGSVILLGITIWLLDKNREQLDRSNSYAETVADASVNAANDARDTLAAAIKKDSPYVRFLCGAGSNTPTAGVCRIQAIAQNIGQSAALDLSYSSTLIYRENGEFQVNGSSSQGPTSMSEMVPFEKDSERGAAMLLGKDLNLADLLNIDRRLYLMLEINFATIFGENVSKRSIYRIAPRSMELISYRAQVKLHEIPDNNFSLPDEKLAEYKANAERSENVMGIDMYVCSEDLFDEARSVLKAHNDKISIGTGMGMPNIGTPDDDE